MGLLGKDASMLLSDTYIRNNYYTVNIKSLIKLI